MLSVFATTTVVAWAPEQAPASLQLEIERRGTVVIKLYTKEAPNTTAQIMRLAKSGFYDGQRFFRVIRSPRPYLVQTGDPLSKDASKLDDRQMGAGGSGTRVKYENSGFPNEEGAVGLSTQPNDRDSGDSQFYILLGNARFLDGNYTVFGKVTKGMDVVKAIEKGDRIASARITN